MKTDSVRSSECPPSVYRLNRPRRAGTVAPPPRAIGTLLPVPLHPRLDFVPPLPLRGRVVVPQGLPRQLLQCPDRRHADDRVILVKRLDQMRDRRPVRRLRGIGNRRQPRCRLGRVPPPGRRRAPDEQTQQTHEEAGPHATMVVERLVRGQTGEQVKGSKGSRAGVGLLGLLKRRTAWRQTVTASREARQGANDRMRPTPKDVFAESSANSASAPARAAMLHHERRMTSIPAPAFCLGSPL